MKRKFRLLIITCCLINILYAQVPRGRVQIQNGTLVSDNGTLLRGAFISTDISDNIPSREDIAAIKTQGLNCIHLYAECPQRQSPGDKVELVDSIVSWAESDSLYIILTIGGGTQNGSFDSAFVYGFWDFYAPRYKDKTHLIYEIVNEPFAWSAPYDSATIAMEHWAYDLIRRHAPETHVLLMTYATAIHAKDVLEDLKQLGESIDWSNASVATHGYGAPSENFKGFVNAIKNAGYALTVTEPENVGGLYMNLASTRVFEEKFVSYTHFVSVQRLLDHPSEYSERVEQSELRWQPDFGNWPLNIDGITYIDPFQSTFAGFYDDGYGFGFNNNDEYTVGQISNGDYIAYYNLNFYEKADSLFVECSSGNWGGKIEIHLDSLNGTLIGGCNVPATASWYDYETFSCSINGVFDGVHSIYFLFKGSQWDLMNLKSFAFSGETSTGLRQTDIKKEVRIYPNPASSNIIIECNRISTFNLFNIHGQLILQKEVEAGNNSIPVNNLPNGLYYVKIENDIHSFSKVIIIKR